MEASDEISELLVTATRPGFRERLTTRGLARAMIWRGGQLPPGSPAFTPTLTSDLLGYGFTILRLALNGRTQDVDQLLLRHSFELAAESIEALVRNGPQDRERGFFRICAAAAYHLAGYSARAFSMMRDHLDGNNMSPCETALALLMLRRLDALRDRTRALVEDDDWSDDRLLESIADEGGSEGVDDVFATALTVHFHRALAAFDHALLTGSDAAATGAIAMLDEGVAVAERHGLVTLWWIFLLARHLLDDLWASSLHRRLPRDGGDSSTNWDRLRRLFLGVLCRRALAEIELWPSQIDAAARAMNPHDDLVVALPTSGGKTRIAEICVLRTLSLGRRALVVTPLRALSAQTERSFRAVFAPLGFSVSSLYGAAGVTSGDLDTLGNRQIVISTPEKLDFALRNDPSLLDDIGVVVLDEGHLIGPQEREIRYEVLVQRLLRRSDAAERRIVCLSAILPDGPQLDDFVSWIRQDEPGAPVKSSWRPTRQRFGEITWQGSHARLDVQIGQETAYVSRFLMAKQPTGRRKKLFPSNQQELVVASAWRVVEEGQRVLVFCAQRRSVEPLAKCILKLAEQGLVSSLLQGDASELHDAETIGAEWLGPDHPAVQCLRLGIAVHHGRLPRVFLREVEALLRRQILPVTIASPTLAQGLNLSASTLLVPTIYRGQGERIKGEEFANVAGRAGRAYVDIDGQVLHVLYEPNGYKLQQWRELVAEAKERTIESGLFQLVASLAADLARSVDLSRDDLVDYLVSTPAIWDAPTSPEHDDDEDGGGSENFDERLARLDAALLALIDPLDCAVADIPKILDRALEQSLWARRLAREDPDGRKLQKAILTGRAARVWSTTTATQRRGYFNAGLGLVTGQFLDSHADSLSKLLAQADAAASEDNIEALVKALSAIAKIVYQTRPFRPDALPDKWPKVMRCWLAGDAVGSITQALGEDAPPFIEDGLSYRLVWALEAIRVRAEAHSTPESDEFTGEAALALETGVSNLSSALLVKAGFPSRIAALKAVADTSADFDTLSKMRIWLRSKAVAQLTTDENWPTLEMSGAWRKFRDEQLEEHDLAWSSQNLKLDVDWISDLSKLHPERLRIIHSEEEKATWLYTADMHRVGRLSKPFRHPPRGVARVTEFLAPGRVQISYDGPDASSLIE